MSTLFLKTTLVDNITGLPFTTPNSAICSCHLFQCPLKPPGGE